MAATTPSMLAETDWLFPRHLSLPGFHTCLFFGYVFDGPCFFVCSSAPLWPSLFKFIQADVQRRMIWKAEMCILSAFTELI